MPTPYNNPHGPKGHEALSAILYQHPFDLFVSAYYSLKPLIPLYILVKRAPNLEI